jgi:Metal-dependent proteases with possible chaperone activity
MELVFPPLRLCGDNAAMIGAMAQIQYDKGDFAELDLNADPSLDFDME